MSTFILEYLRQAARAAHNNISHRPDQRGDLLIAEYSDELSRDLAQIAAWAPANEDLPVSCQAIITEKQVRYQTEYVSRLRAWIGATSRCASSFICGPANFPVARMQKRTATADRRYAEFRQWREKALKGINRSLNPKEPVDELAEAKARLAARERDQHHLKEGNKAIRAAKGDKELATLKLLALGHKGDAIYRALNPSHGKPGFPSWMLDNNNKEIHRLRDRVTVLEAKQAEGEAVGGERRVPFAGGEVILNYVADRVQIAHEAKPAAAVIAQLKQAAFKWSPTNQAWQRKITPFAIADAQRITGALLIESKPVLAVPLVEAIVAGLAVLPQAWQRTGKPYPAEVEQQVRAALAAGEGILSLARAGEELLAALPDPSFARNHGVDPTIVHQLAYSIRTAKETAAASATLPEEASPSDEDDDD